MNTNQKGLLGELRVAQELLKAGYEVFAPLTGKASCDLVAVKDGQLLRVQIKATSQAARYGQAYVIDGRTITSAKKGNSVKQLDRTTFDLLGIYVIPEDLVVLVPVQQLPDSGRFTVRNGALLNQKEE